MSDNEVPVREGSYLTNDLATVQQARLERIKNGFLFPPTFRTYKHYRTEYPSIRPEQWEFVFGTRAAEWEFRLLLEDYAERIAATGTVMHSLGRACDLARNDVETVKELGSAMSQAEEGVKLGEQMKLLGLERAAMKYAPDLERAKICAEFLGMGGEIVDADMVRAKFLEVYQRPLKIGNAVGKLFLGGKWEKVGYRKSSRPSSHARMIAQWRLFDHRAPIDADRNPQWSKA